MACGFDLTQALIRRLSWFLEHCHLLPDVDFESSLDCLDSPSSMREGKHFDWRSSRTVAVGLYLDYKDEIRYELSHQ